MSPRSTLRRPDDLAVHLEEMRPQIYARCRARLPTQDAEDATQEIMAVLWRRYAHLLPRLDSTDQLRLIGGVSRNVIRNAQRRLARAPAPDADAGQAVAGAALPLSPLALSIRDALRNLSDADREMLLLATEHGLSYAGIAGRLGVSASRVRNVLYRVRKQLRECLREG